MIAGRELDALVAQRVMGWRRMSYHQTQPTNIYYADRHELTWKWYDNGGKEVFIAEPSDCIDCGTDFLPFSPSTSIADAWLVVEKMTNGDFTVMHSYGTWKAGYLWLSHPTSPAQEEPCWTCEATALTAPHAICLAALKAVSALPQPHP